MRNGSIRALSEAEEGAEESAEEVMSAHAIAPLEGGSRNDAIGRHRPPAKVSRATPMSFGTTIGRQR